VTHPEPEFPYSTAQESILQEAQRITGGDRNRDYGSALDDYTRTAELWTALLRDKLKPGHTIEWHDAIRCMIAVKLSRDTHCMTRDNAVDIAGYARCRQDAAEADSNAEQISLRD